ncbi:MAG: flavin reductase family protein [Ignavibacteriae bacterium]|nr:MAG: flavin reductase family protein [Ignavibacteriota bacterium]
MQHFDPKDLSVPEVHKLLLGGVVPRPIALVSTISENDINNLSPFSFFNAFGANPPLIAFSPNRRGKDGSLKDTYNNLLAVKECVVQAVTYEMVEQVSLSSTEYPPDVDEFIKSGLTSIDSEIVKPKRVKESPFQMECILKEMNSYGQQGGSANMAICEVVKFHVTNDVFTNGIIDPLKIDLVGRMSANYYSRASSGVFEVEKPNGKKSIGYDQLPNHIKSSEIYTANNLARFANSEEIPSKQDVEYFIRKLLENDIETFEATVESFEKYHREKDHLKMLQTAILLDLKDTDRKKTFIELSAKCALENIEMVFAWKAALYAGLL